MYNNFENTVIYRVVITLNVLSSNENDQHAIDFNGLNKYKLKPVIQ